jgi:hypothetical protein
LAASEEAHINGLNGHSPSVTGELDPSGVDIGVNGQLRLNGSMPNLTRNSAAVDIKAVKEDEEAFHEEHVRTEMFNIFFLST